MFSSKLSKLRYPIPAEKFDDGYNSEKYFFVILGHWVNAIVIFVQIYFFRWGCYDCIQCVQRNILSQRMMLVSFPGVDQKNFSLLAEAFRRTCRKYIVRVWENILEELFWKKV